MKISLDETIIEIERSGFNELKKDYLRVRDLLLNEKIIIVRDYFDTEWCHKLTNYLAIIGKNSLPNYYPITDSTPNFHRINNEDPRSYIKGIFHQFNFFPWNQDIFSIFEVCYELFEFKNLANGRQKNNFMTHADDDCTARVSVQFYPSGGGYLKAHKDPVGQHQLVLPSITLSDKGADYKEGGLYVVNSQGVYIDLDSKLRKGDVVLFNPNLIHEVKPIDPTHELDWLEFKGRWMLFLAVNKLNNNESIPNSIEISR